MESSKLESKMSSMELFCKDEQVDVPSVSIPLEEGETYEQMDLNEFANKLAAELHRVKAIVGLVSVEEIGARIEECKVAMCMYKNLFEVLVTEHTKRLNVLEEKLSVNKINNKN